jgi:DNA-binding MarR family transcriptional regulator
LKYKVLCEHNIILKLVVNKGDAMLHPDFKSELQEIVRLDQVLHAPARLLTVILLNQSVSLDFHQLMDFTELTWGNLSTHLSKLEDAGYVMITKTFKGKRPRTLVSLTDSGRQAYLQWGQTIIKALPQQVKEVAYRLPAEAEWARQQLPDFERQINQPLTPNRDVFFLPRYHRWGMELPPIKEFMPLL